MKPALGTADFLPLSGPLGCRSVSLLEHVKVEAARREVVIV
jgi:hypothetical protein